MKYLAAATFLLIAWAGQAAAGTREDVLSGASRCGAISDDRKWLDCFYGSAQAMRSKLGLPPAPAFQTGLVPPAGPAPLPTDAGPSVPPAAATQVSRPGFFGRMLGGQIVLSNIPITSYSFDRAGYFTVTLANGQVWRQEDNEQLARWNKPPAHYSATISKGALNSYNFRVQDDGNLYKVRRLR